MTAVIGVVADDLTGAGDIAGILARAGARTRLCVGLTPDSKETADAIVVALKSRTAPAKQAVSESRAALSWLQSQGARTIIFKVCSTFDSTPTGNIGPVAEALLQDMGAQGAVVCPAFPANARTVYQGHLFVGDRLLSETGMREHPLTPMTDPDIRRWLAMQCRAPVGLVALAELRGGDLGPALARRFGNGERLVVVDAVDDDDLKQIAAAAVTREEPRLLVGGSAIALGLPELLGLSAGKDRPPTPCPGPGVVLAGSCSAATRAQVSYHEKRFPALQLRPDQPEAGMREAALAFLEGNIGQSPLIYTSAPPSEVASLQAAEGRDVVAGRVERVLADLACRCVERGVTRLVVAGGETSGAVAAALSARSYDIGAEIAPGVPTLYPVGAQGPGIVLKSGNFGAPEFFATALATLEAGR